MADAGPGRSGAGSFEARAAWFAGLCADPTAEARLRKRAGAFVVGMLGTTVPIEMVRAAGLHPVSVRGTPGVSTPLADRYMEVEADGDIRSIFDGLLAGAFDFLDALVIPRSSEGFLQLYYYLLEMPRWEPIRRLPELFLLDILHTPFRLTAAYDKGRLEDFGQQLARWSGRPFAGTDLPGEITRENRNRSLLRRANALRREARISGADMMRLIASRHLVDVDRHTDALDGLLRAKQPAPRPGRRLLVKGPAEPSFFELVETMAATIVADDGPFGENEIGALVPTDIDPLDALVRHYQCEVPNARSYPQRREDARLLQLVESARADGVVFVFDANDDTYGWDYPAQKALLEERGIPSMRLLGQSYQAPDRTRQRAEVGAFLATLPQREAAVSS